MTDAEIRYLDSLKRTLRSACAMLDDIRHAVGGAPAVVTFVNDALDRLADDPRNGRAERAERTTDPAPPLSFESGAPPAMEEVGT